MRIVVPAAQHLESYVAAPRRGWSPDTIDANAGRLQIGRAEVDPEGSLTEVDDPQGLGSPIVLPDGSSVRRLPSFRRWMWDDAFVGGIGFGGSLARLSCPRTFSATSATPVVPWGRRHGHATSALGQLLEEVAGLAVHCYRGVHPRAPG